ncbi:MAG: FAD-dependent oxidoreductase [Desulfobulbus sp.]|jgi:NADPH-dependent 2,4-dienoyl-CoA reductase/sulfur reductase-like enzyme/rhodanese-related sulfurtransferase|uniref:FAD-dependent oxidoreductase n=1 Tax=Desulfobulbus sp. TaxID=895 RepID=UPI00284EE21F|nr:FAD-dependent oxidoreductase [Desulfobulbus sp.]MDR2549923.1 FAD-dependent oxidoreductase [Desulfobulbus sp.]
MSKKVVIIGAVAAGPKAASRLKRLCPDWDVTMVDQDSLISYGGCGIPYYVSGDVSDESELRATSFHVVRDAAFFEHSKGVRVLTRTRAVAIDRENKQVLVRNLDSNEEQRLAYDYLMLATGAKPFELPIPGMGLDGVFTIADLHKAIEIKARIAQGKVSRAVVIGGGAIGIEMAEALTDLWGIETTLLELAPQLLPKLVDRHFATMLARHLEEKGVPVLTRESATELVDDGQGRVCGVKTGQRILEADLVIVAAGVRPRSELAKAAGLDVAPWGGIKVNQRLQTTDPAIYAAGDCIAVANLVTGRDTHAPLGSLANREGRVVADNMAGIPSQFGGVCGSFIMKAFERCIAATGLTYEAALAEGFAADYALTSPADRAHFFPDQAVVILQLVFDRRSRRVLGLQAFGMMNDSISARVDTAAALIAKGGTIEDFGLVEMAYAPPFSSAIDSINAAAYVAENMCDNRLRRADLDRFLAWMEDMSIEPDWAVLDLRHPLESAAYVEKYGVDKWVGLEYGQVRKRYRELPSAKTYIILCNAGTRSYEVQVFLDHIGKIDSMVLCGGLNVISRLGVGWLLK